MTVVIVPTATRDLEEFAVRLEAEQAGLNLKFQLAFASAVEFIERFPLIGPMVAKNSLTGVELRVRPLGEFRKHLVLYAASEERAVVLRIVHSAKNLNDMLEAGILQWESET